MYVEAIKKSQLCDFLFLKNKLACFDDINTIQEQPQTAVAPLKAQDFCVCSEQQWSHWPDSLSCRATPCKVTMKLNTKEKPHKLYHLA